uniref:GPI inositol-deacylase PGAP1-like alpha/beta domain-containing protein n=1 Tax=Trichogramma kaykai TaxID=54128 RepID=A0ABD2WVH2_9HYME
MANNAESAQWEKVQIDTVVCYEDATETHRTRTRDSCHTGNIKDLKNNGTTVISIGGGPRDILVPSFQTIDERADINTLTTSIPGVWRSTDHLCLLWCKQLILNIVRSLFDCVDTSQKPPAITDNIETRLKAFKWHFVQRGTKE